MEPDRFQLASEVFLEASQMSAADRAALIEVKCGGDGEVRALVEQLLRGHERSLHATRDVGKAASVAAHDAIAGARAGEVVGAYVLVSKLGEGGFGDVWLAERRTPYVQQVAIKIIKPGMDSRAVVARFQQERQSLAIMDHPGIARVMDGGVTSTGRPYFVMDYVKGEPITQYCDRVRLGVRERLALFIRVCEAVQHAHMKGIIHRDIKPSNILVEEIDGTPMPKVIDFGIAKAIDASGLGETLKTEQGIMIGTPEYMSPEQAGGEPDIDTRTDVYSLGVLLYELLVGVPPFDGQELRVKGYEEIRRIIRETEPPRPSTRMLALGASKAAGSTAETSRGAMDTRAMSRTLRRELEWIPLKALRKERDERYESPADLARDVRAYLLGEPLITGPRSRAYVIRKFIRRHRVPIAVLACVVFALAAGFGTALWQWRESERQRATANSQRIKAQEQADIANATLKFVRDMFQSIDPTQARGETITVQEVMATATTHLGRNPIKSAAVAAQINGLIGEVQYALGNFVAARSRLVAAAQAAEDAWGHDSEQAILARAGVDVIDVSSGNTNGSILESAKAILALPEAQSDNYYELYCMAATVSSFVPDAGIAKQLQEKTLRLLDIAGVPAESLERNYYAFQRALGDSDLVSGTVRMKSELSLGERKDPMNPMVLQMRSAYRMRIQSLGRRDEAIYMAQESILRKRGIYLDPSRDLADELKELGTLLAHGVGDCDEGLANLREAVRIYDQCGIHCDGSGVLSALDTIGNCLTALGRHEECARHYTQALERLDQCPSPSPDARYFFHLNRGIAYRDMNSFDRALADFQTAQRVANSNTGPAWAQHANEILAYIDQAKRSLAPLASPQRSEPDHPQ